jgi:hypothetical protein
VSAEMPAAVRRALEAMGAAQRAEAAADAAKRKAREARAALSAADEDALCRIVNGERGTV